MARVATSKCRGMSPGFSLSRGNLGRGLSIFIDESGDHGGKARYYCSCSCFMTRRMALPA